jgi:hypothetical protein
MPLSRSQQAEFRPLVARAWAQQAGLVGRPVGDAMARDAWYREQIHTVTGGRSRSSRDLTPQEYRSILERLTLIAAAEVPPHIDGFTPPQNARFSDLARKAWRLATTRGQADGLGLVAWVDAQLVEIGVWKRSSSRVDGFDAVMAAFAVIAFDEYWIDKTSKAAEDRMRWVIRSLLRDLSELGGREVGWDYVLGIWTQSELLPSDIADAPAQTLWKVLQMLDTHVRRISKHPPCAPKA